MANEIIDGFSKKGTCEFVADFSEPYATQVICALLGLPRSEWRGLAQLAVDMGLADELGSLDYVAREVVKAEDIVDYTQRDNVAERLARRFGAALGVGAIQALRSAPLLR